VGSKIFLFGGAASKHRSTFNYFDLLSKKWASEVEGDYQKEEDRKMPFQVYRGKAVLISPDANWTNLDATKHEDRFTVNVDDRFEPLTGNVMQPRFEVDEG
jgi:hypothetical protein